MNLTHRIVGNLLVIAWGAESGSESEWQACLDDVRRRPGTVNRLLLFSAGGALNPKQRAALGKLMQTGDWKAVVLTDSAAMKNVAIALAWLGGDVKTFNPSDLPEALKFLGADSAQSHRIAEALYAMKSKVSASSS